MKTAELQFNVIYTPGTVRYLTPFIASLLRWSDCRYRLVANGCSDDEVKLLSAVADLDDRLELLVMPEKRMVPSKPMEYEPVVGGPWVLCSSMGVISTVHISPGPMVMPGSASNRKHQGWCVGPTVTSSPLVDVQW